MKKHRVTTALALLTFALPIATVNAAFLEGSNKADTLFGLDNDNEDNPVIDIFDTNNQSLLNTDVIEGRRGRDVLIGLLGNDVLKGDSSSDVLVGGTENFIGPNKDVIFGGNGDDTNVWAPGDGDDAFIGGRGDRDAQVFGVIDADVVGVVPDDDPDNGGKEIKVPVLNEETGLPTANVTGSPGFCTLERVEDPELGFDFLVRFFVRDPEALAVTIRLKDVEQVFCTSEAGGAITFADLRAHDPQFVEVPLQEVGRLNRTVAQIIR